MINKREIMDHSGRNDLPANTIEKDYVLNWVLFGIKSSSEIRDKWIFKGGTCLKKCYFKEYRFSEDLDFTIIDKSHVDEKYLIKTFKNIAEWIYDNSGIDIPTDRLSFEEYENPRGYFSIEGKIPYKGPMQRRGNYPTIKLNLSHDELLVHDSVLNPIYHPYSDLPKEEQSARTYCIEEIMAEKLRALVERLSPRDLYDVVHIHTDKRIKPKKALVLNILHKKCEYKNVEMPTMTFLENSPNKQDVYADWGDMLAHQISNLVSCDHYWKKLPSVFRWLYE